MYLLRNTSMAVLIIFIPVFSLIASDKDKKIDQLMQKYFDYDQFNGSVLVAQNGQVMYKKGFGYADMEWNIPNQPDTKFRLASVTKQFTATLIMQLVEEGRLQLENKISDHIPYYRKDTGSKVTIHHLLSHTSGIPNFTNNPDYQKKYMRQRMSPDSIVARLCMEDLEFEPGSRNRYSNSAYIILGVIIEKVSKRSYEQMLSEKIFNPLDMTDSGYDHSERIIARRAAGYDRTLTGYRNADFLDMSLPFAAGALYSTVEDLFKWDRGLYTEKIISDQSKEKMFTPVLDRYGYGWGVYRFPGFPGDTVKAVAHSGGIEGFNCRIMRILDDQHLVVLLANAPGAPLTQIVQNIVSILYDRPFDYPKRYASDEIARVIRLEGPEAAARRFTELKEKQSNEYEINEGQFNVLGYHLLASGRHDLAIAVFKMNVTAFPNSANTYDSLAEAYMEKGDKKMAVKYYQKTLDMLDQDQSLSEDFRQRLRLGAQESLKILNEQR